MVALQNATIFLVNNLGITVYLPMRYLIKYRGGDPRNHSWYEISDYDYIRVDEERYFKKVEGRLSSKQKLIIKKMKEKNNMTIGLKDLSKGEGLTGPARRDALDKLEEEKIQVELLRNQISEEMEDMHEVKKEKERKSRLKRKNKKELDK